MFLAMRVSVKGFLGQDNIITSTNHMFDLEETLTGVRLHHCGELGHFWPII